jgi:DNA repair protein RadC
VKQQHSDRKEDVGGGILGAAPRLYDVGEEGVRRARRADLRGATCGTVGALAVLMGAGRQDDHAGAARLLADCDASKLSQLEAGELVALHGLPPAAARRISAAFALGTHLHGERLAARPLVRGPDAAAELLRPLLSGLEQEVFVTLLLDAKHRLRRAVRVSQGTLTSSLVHPREVFRAAVREGAAAILVAHNHPSGDPTPSLEDLAVTTRLFEASRLMGIPLLDHVILGASNHTSIHASHGIPPRGLPTG